MDELKITKIGNSLGVILPKELLKELEIKEGSALYSRVTSEGFEAKTYRDEGDVLFEKKMEEAEKFMRKYRNTFKKLAE